jgi:hypothetical protein
MYVKLGKNKRMVNFPLPEEDLRPILEDFQKGNLAIEQAVEKIETWRLKWLEEENNRFRVSARC